MGEIADDMMEGACCSWCMQYFVEEHGYPVLCTACWVGAQKKDREGFKIAYQKEV